MQYSVALPSTRSDESKTLRQPSSEAELFNPQKVTTLYENFQRGLRLSSDQPCLGFRIPACKGKPASNFQWLTYSEVNVRLTNFGSGLLGLHARVCGKANFATHWHLGIYSINRPEWIIAEQAANAYSLVTVALYDTLGASTLAFTINHAELGVIVCSFDKISNLLRVAHECPCLKVIVSMDSLDNRESAHILRSWASEKGVLIVTMSELEVVGIENPLSHIPPRSEDLATICYTSGTTGNPKGAMLIHKNFVASGHSVAYHGIEFHSSDVMISYLPLAHCFERVLHVAMYNAGASIGFYRGDVLLLVEDIACLRPTCFPSVPRLFNRIHAKLVEGTLNAPGVKGMLCRRGYAAKVANMNTGGGLSHFFWDRVLFKKVAAVLGGRVRIMMTGSAPISGDVLTFLRLMFSCEILEGYGQTECAAGSTATFPGDYLPNQVGSPFACNEIKLVDVPEMGYLHTDKQPRGEVCIRGHNVMAGYFKEPEKTKETIDELGWLHTGDIGLITSQGTLAIIDRKKNIFKLAQGEYVAPEKLETVYQKCPFVMQAFVHGDSLQSELVAIIVPEPEKCIQWADKNLSFATEMTVEEKIAALATDVKFRAFMMQELNGVGKHHKLSGFEMIKNFHLEKDPFSVENDLLTPSFKLKRNIAQKRYRVILDHLYAELNSKTAKARL